MTTPIAVMAHLGEVSRRQRLSHHGLDPLEDLLLLVGVARGHVSSNGEVKVNRVQEARGRASEGQTDATRRRNGIFVRSLLTD